MIKSLLPAVMLLLMLSSCKKKYTCDCSTKFTYKSTNGGYGNQTFPGEKKAYSVKMSKKKAKAACDDEELSISSNITNFITDNNAYPLQSGESVITECDITL